jgi:dephospho-CoA kinase
MKWVGLTGGLGTGKSTVSQMLIKRGIPVIDADRVAREVVEPHGPAYLGIIQSFGRGILKPDGSLDRTLLAQAAFGDPQKLLQLERLVHPHVQAEVLRQRQWLQDQHHQWAVYDVPLLFEKGLQSQFDFIVVVSIMDVAMQISRLKQRNGWSEEEIQKRLKSQLPLSGKATQADYVIQNDADLSSLEKKVDTMVQMLNDLWQDN